MKNKKSSSFVPNTRQQKPEGIASILQHTFYNPAIKQKIKEYEAFPFWEKIVGEKIAKVAKPEKIIRGKILQIRVLDSVWAQEISLMKSKIIDDFFEYGKGARIEDIKFVIGNPKNFKNE